MLVLLVYLMFSGTIIFAIIIIGIFIHIHRNLVSGLVYVMPNIAVITPHNTAIIITTIAFFIIIILYFYQPY